MYQFSRTIYRELTPYLSRAGSSSETRQRVLDSCESTMQRLLTDRRYFARPTKTLFCDLRGHFTMTDQLDVYRVVDRNIRLALQYLDSTSIEELLGETRRECRAHTRKGTPCQREPLPSRDYCPSHKHLEEDLKLAPASEPAERIPIYA